MHEMNFDICYIAVALCFGFYYFITLLNDISSWLAGRTLCNMYRLV